MPRMDKLSTYRTTWTQDGELDQRFSACETSGETWPLGKALAAPYRRA